MISDQNPATSAETTRMVIERFNEAFNRHNAEALALLLTDDTVFEDTSPAPDGRRIEGKAVVRWIYRKSRNGQQWHLRGVDVFTVRGDKVAAKLAYVKG